MIVSDNTELKMQNNIFYFISCASRVSHIFIDCSRSESRSVIEANKSVVRYNAIHTHIYTINFIVAF